MTWLFEKSREYGGEVFGAMTGGFIAYVLHTAYHSIWKRPGHWLAKRIGRKSNHPE